MNIANILVRAASTFDKQAAVAFGEDILLNYQELANNSAVLALNLVTHYNLRPGDRVAIITNNCPEYIEILFAVWHAGLVVVPINAKLHKKEFNYVLSHSDAKVCFSSSKLLSVITPLSEEIEALQQVIEISSAEYKQLLMGNKSKVCSRQPNDPAWLFYTSGTTGKPKGAMQSHKNLQTMIQCYFSDIDSINAGDAIFHPAPMSHGSGYYILPHIVKGGLNVIPKSGGFNEQELLTLLNAYKNVSLFAAPTMVKRWLNFAQKKTHAFKHLKTIIYGGGPMYLQDLDSAQQLLGNKLVQMYGQGECPMTICALTHYQHQDSNHPDYKNRLASIGMPMSGMEVKLTDKLGNTVEQGQPGEILVRGDAVMLEYFKNDKATQETLVDGWLKTGDIAIQNIDGFITLVDRAKDVIISGGSNIYPREVEEVLNQHPDVDEVSVIGRKDTDWGEVVIAIVVSPNEQLTSGHLDAFCIENMTRFKRPKKYIFINNLPKNNTGKILKTTLRELYS
jgi:long-chain acyl-CoA synthetase